MFSNFKLVYFVMWKIL